MNRSPRWIGDRGLSPPPQSKRQRWMKPALIGCGGLLGLCVVITIIAALFANGDDNEDDNQATVGCPAAQRALPPSQPNRRRLRRLPRRSTRSHAERRPGNERACTRQHARTGHTPAGTLQTGVAITLVTAHGGPPGGDAYVEAKVTPGAISDLDYFTPSGTESEAEGLDEKTADASGDIRWDWSIGPSTDPGEGSGDGYLRRCEREREHHDRIAPLCAGLGLQTDKMIYFAPANEVAGAVFLSPAGPDRTVGRSPMSQVYRHSAHHDS